MSTKLLNRVLCLLCGNYYAGSGFIAEEGTAKDNGEKYRWVIDPLDGTTNYIHGISPFAVSIALMEDQEIIMGVIYEISLNEMFYAWKGSKAYLNGREIRGIQSFFHWRFAHSHRISVLRLL